MSNRRQALKTMLAGAAALSTQPASALSAMSSATTDLSAVSITPRKGNIRHSVCRWCFGKIPLEDLCAAVKPMGITAIDLIGPSEWHILKKHGLDSSMCNGAEISLTEGWNETKYHAQLIKNYTEMIPKVAEAGYKNLICFSGNRRGMKDEKGWRNCAAGLKKIMPLAEKHGVIIQMELLNSKVDHKDYMCDRTSWGAELCRRVNSPNFKLLYDIYHMQIDEGDVIRTIKDNHTYIGHYHTAGVPGRHEIDESQELYYPAIMKAILNTGFKGYVAQEFIPLATDGLASLRQSIDICDI
jgi:hydroxypyruvate isomerase